MSVFISHFRFLAIAGLVFILANPSADSAPVRDKYVEADLITAYDAIVPGQEFVVGVKLNIDSSWHTYWINPGAAGTPTSVEWELPEGFEAGALQFPSPHLFMAFGMVGFGYQHEVIHLVTMKAPENLSPGTSVTLKGKVKWLVCDPQQCVPGKAELSLELKVAGERGAETANAGAIETARQAVPKVPDGWQAGYTLQEGQIVMTVAVGEGLASLPADLVMYPETEKMVELADKAVFDLQDGMLTIRVKAHDPELESPPSIFRAVLHSAQGFAGEKSVLIIARKGATPEFGVAVDVKEESEVSANSTQPESKSLISVLAVIFIGGLILNIMPCVFPVISLKIMSFVEQSGESRRRVLAHSLVFTLGILVFFWTLVAVLLILRSGGEKVGWGFQMQSPLFMMGMIAVMFVLALSLFGVFEFGMRMTGVGGKLSLAKGYQGSFWSGALAVLLATPCAGPFLGPLIGYALAQSPAVSLLVFTSMALGMASPYILLSAVPKLLDYVPRPGAWMETFRNLMGFPMLIAVVWLLWVLGDQIGNDSLALFLGALVIIAAALWLYGKYLALGTVGGKHPVIWIMVVAMAISSVVASGVAYDLREKSDGADIAKIVSSYRKEGRAVFVDFTAKWCLVCQANKAAMHSEEVQEAFRKKGVEFVIADWTKENPHIADFLDQYGRASVPFYPLFPADPSKEPIILPQNLTKGIILEYLDKL